jgi:alkylation response protein AidB-like acyl-CoA dehydrogenase
MMDSETQAEIKRGLEAVFCDRAAARAVADGAAPGADETWKNLVALGLVGLSLPEALGGSGGAIGDEAIVVERLGYVVAPVPAITTICAAHVLGSGESELARQLAQRLARGEAKVGVALSAEHGTELPVASVEDGADAILDGTVPDLIEGCDLDVLLIPRGGKWWAVDVPGAGVEVEALETVDPTRPYAKVTLAAAKGRFVSTMNPADVLAMAWALFGAESVGVAQAALDLAVEYSLDRKQFGQPIGRFQAIKHKMTDSLVALEAGRSAVLGAVSSDVPDQRMARIAKATATAAAIQVVGDAIQTHGAIGCTWEHDLHLLLRRAKFCQLVLQSPDEHLALISDELLRETRELNRLAYRDRPRVDVSAGLAIDAESQAFIDEFRDWLDRTVTPELKASLRVPDRDSRNAALRDWQALMDDGGWSGVHWPREAGGRDASILQQALYHLEIGQRRLPVAIGNRGLALVGPTIIRHGTEEQKQRFLRATRRADILWASGLSEPSSGSDLASLRTRGIVDGNELVVSGHKIWTTNAEIADYLFALIRTGPAVPKHDGISCVAIPMNSPGVEVRPIKRMTGVADFNEVFLDEVRVPLDSVFGKINEGWKVAKTTLSHEHLTNFLGRQLRAETVVATVLSRLAEREDKHGVVDTSLRRRVAQAFVNAQLLRLHGLRNVTKVQTGQDPGAEGSIMKLFGQEEEKRVFELAVDVKGSDGILAGTWPTAYLSTRASTIGGGTSEVHRNKIAERVLGMPRDIWADEEPAGGKLAV